MVKSKAIMHLDYQKLEKFNNLLSFEEYYYYMHIDDHGISNCSNIQTCSNIQLEKYYTS